MDRLIDKELIAWKESPDRLPLIIRGARQVGKSFAIEKLGREHFESLVVVNFELEPHFMSCFDSLDPDTIISKIELYTMQFITEGKTLLFFDEIQKCPRALLAMRYFKEKKPHLHVIAAGSLLEFTLNEEDFSFPVGRVQFMYMRPLSLKEFMLNMGYAKLADHLAIMTPEMPPDPILHEHLLGIVRNYMLLGGMPAVVSKYITTKSHLEAQRLQSVLLNSYRNDFGKHAAKAQYKYLQMFFEKAPLLVAQHFKYAKIDPEVRSRELKTALEQLCLMGLINRIFSTNANGIPLHAEIHDNKFKLLFLDVGLMQRANKIDSSAILNEDIVQINKGALAEQFVGQELLAASDCYENGPLYFWEREPRATAAEVDYVIQVGSSVVPIEVKSGEGGRLKSLKRFLEDKKSNVGITISQANLECNHGILRLPLYLIDQLPRIVRYCLNK